MIWADRHLGELPGSCICSVGSPDLPSPSVDTNLLFPSDSIPPSVFYSQSTRTQNRPVTHQADLQTHPIRSVHPYRTRLLAATTMPLEYIIGNPPTIVSLRRQAVCSWAQCRPNKCLVKFLPVSQDAPLCPDSKGAS